MKMPAGLMLCKKLVANFPLRALDRKKLSLNMMYSRELFDDSEPSVMMKTLMSKMHLKSLDEIES